VDEIKTKLGQSGRIVIPTEYRKKLGLKSGDEIIMHLDEAGLHIYTPAQAVARAQALVRCYVPEGRNLSEELISERREEANRE
jgi:AbrB family looped-hinge helix DNA binding protein